jgi:hypothetical protein
MDIHSLETFSALVKAIIPNLLKVLELLLSTN